MEDRDQSGQVEVAPVAARLIFRPATEHDRAFVRGLTATAFAPYGDYDAIMDGWLSDPRTRTIIAETAGRHVGFAMWAAPSHRSAEVVLVSLALVPESRGQGLGRQMLAIAHRAIAAEEPNLAREIALDVAEDNAAARALFRSAGYRMSPAAEGSYPSGQRALRMVLRLVAANAGG